METGNLEFLLLLGAFFVLSDLLCSVDRGTDIQLTKRRGLELNVCASTLMVKPSTFNPFLIVGCSDARS